VSDSATPLNLHILGTSPPVLQASSIAPSLDLTRGPVRGRTSSLDLLVSRSTTCQCSKYCNRAGSEPITIGSDPGSEGSNARYRTQPHKLRLRICCIVQSVVLAGTHTGHALLLLFTLIERFVVGIKVYTISIITCERAREVHVVVCFVCNEGKMDHVVPGVLSRFALCRFAVVTRQSFHSCAEHVSHSLAGILCSYALKIVARKVRFRKRTKSIDGPSNSGIVQHTPLAIAYHGAICPGFYELPHTIMAVVRDGKHDGYIPVKCLC